MTVTRRLAVKVIIVILYLLTACHSYPGSIEIENNENKQIQESIKQETRSLIFDNANTTLHRHMKVNLTRFDRSVHPDTPSDDDLTLSDSIVITNPTETTNQDDLCGIQKINFYFESTISVIRQWLKSLIDDCNKINEILNSKIETTNNKTDIENIRENCIKLKGIYLQLFKSIISALNKLQIKNHDSTNNTCPIMVGLEKIRNDLISFIQLPHKLMINNPFTNLLKKLPGLIPSDNTVPQNNSDLNIFNKNSKNLSLMNIISNLWNVPQKVQGSIEELISNLRKIVVLDSCQEVKGFTNSNISDVVDNLFHLSNTSINLPHLENVLKLSKIMRSPLNNPISQAFNNLRVLLQQIREIIDERISNIRNIFVKNNCQELEAMMNNNFSSGNNLSDSSIGEKSLNGLLKTLFNSPIAGISVFTTPFSKVFNNLREIPEKVKKSIDEVISTTINILNPRRCYELKSMTNSNINDSITNSSELAINNKILSFNPFENILKFPTLLKSPFNNPISQAFNNLRDLLQDIQKTVDEQISNLKNIFTNNNCKELLAMTSGNFGNLNNSSSTSTNEKFSNGLLKNLFNSPITEKFMFNNPFLQAFDNIRNIPQKIRTSIDEVISNLRDLFTLRRCRELRTLINYSTTANGSEAMADRVFAHGKKLSLQNPLDRLFGNLFQSSTAPKSSSKNLLQDMIKLIVPSNLFSQALENLHNLPQEMKKIIDELILNIRNMIRKGDSKEVEAKTNNDINNKVDYLPSSPICDKLPFQKSSNGTLKNIFEFRNPFSQALDNLRNFPEKMKNSIDEVINNIRNFSIPERFRKWNNVKNSKTSDPHGNSSGSSGLENLLSNLSPFKFSHNNLFSQALDNLRNLPKKMQTLIDEQISNIRKILITDNCKERKTVINSDITTVANDLPVFSVNKNIPFSEPWNEFFNKLFNSSKSSSANPFSQAFENLQNLPRKMQNSIDKQIVNLRNIFTKFDPEESKSTTDGATTDSDDNNVLTNFFKILNEEIKKIFTSSKLLSHNSNPLEKLLKQLSSNVQNLFEPKEPKTENLLNKFDPSIIYKVLSPSFIISELFKNTFKSISHTKSSGNTHFSNVFKNLHYFGHDVNKSIIDLIKSARHVFKSNGSRGHKTSVNKFTKKQQNSANVIVHNPYYLFKKQSNTLPSIKSPAHCSWIQLFNKPSPNKYDLSAYKNSPFLSSLYKNKIYSKPQSHSSKYYFPKKYF